MQQRQQQQQRQQYQRHQQQLQQQQQRQQQQRQRQQYQSSSPQYDLPSSPVSKPMKQHLQQRDIDDPDEKLVMAAIRERASTWTNATAMFPPQPPNAARGCATTEANFMAYNIF